MITQNTTPTDLLDKISAAFDRVQELKSSQPVIVMHPSAAILAKDKITRYAHIDGLREAYLFDGKHPLYISFYLPVNHFAVMSQGEYDEWSKKPNEAKI